MPETALRLRIRSFVGTASSPEAAVEKAETGANGFLVSVSPRQVEEVKLAGYGLFGFHVYIITIVFMEYPL